MTLIKTSLLNGIAVIIKMLTLLGLNKILAIYVGPSGYAALGQFQNAVQMITSLASGAISTGVTKYTAEYWNDDVKQHAIWRTGGTISLVGSVLVASVVIWFNNQLAEWFFKDDNLGTVFIWFSATLVMFVFNTLLLAVLNGKKEVKRYVIANIIGSIVSFLITVALAMRMGLFGALIALATYHSFSFLVTMVICYQATWFRVRYFFGKVDKSSLQKLGSYTLMALTSAICVPLSHIFVRNHLGDTLSWEAAGYWEAMWRLSSAYLMLVTTTLSLYYLPRLSELQNIAEIKKEIINGYKIILPAAAVCGTAIYLLRDVIINLLFSREFSGMEVLFGWQMVGDSLKIGGWILAYLMLGKAMVRLFIISEIAFSFLFCAFTYYFTGLVGLEGVAIAHALNYLLYWVFLAVFISI